MVDVIYIAVLVAFFALMVAFVGWCEHIVGKEDVTGFDLADDDRDDTPVTGRTVSDTTVKMPEEVTS